MHGGKRHLRAGSVACRRSVAPALVCVAVLCGALPSAAAEEAKPVALERARPAEAKPQSAAPALAPALPEAKSAAAKSPATLTLETFLDRLMIAESNGKDDARNPRSTATGPFQFIQGTFLEVVRRHFAGETASLSPAAVLALRTDRAFARRAAEAYAKDNAAHLAREGLPASFPNLRLAYLTGPGGAARVLRASPDAKVSTLLSPGAMTANPFMSGMTAADLVAKCARDLEVNAQSAAGIMPDRPLPGSGASRPKVAVKCNLGLPSCRRWLALQTAKLERKVARADGPPAGRNRRGRK